MTDMRRNDALNRWCSLPKNQAAAADPSPRPGIDTVESRSKYW